MKKISVMLILLLAAMMIVPMAASASELPEDNIIDISTNDVSDIVLGKNADGSLFYSVGSAAVDYDGDLTLTGRGKGSVKITGGDHNVILKDCVITPSEGKSAIIFCEGFTGKGSGSLKLDYEGQNDISFFSEVNKSEKTAFSYSVFLRNCPLTISGTKSSKLNCGNIRLDSVFGDEFRVEGDGSISVMDMNGQIEKKRSPDAFDGIKDGTAALCLSGTKNFLGGNASMQVMYDAEATENEEAQTGIYHTGPLNICDSMKLEVKGGNAIYTGSRANAEVTVEGNAYVDARSSKGAGISAYSNVHITDNATVRAYGGLKSAGIGAGFNRKESGFTITIDGECRVNAWGGDDESTGYAVSCYTYEQENAASSERTADGGAGIGGCSDCSSGNVIISGSANVNAHGAAEAAGIGGGSEGVLNSVTITGTPHVEAYGGQSYYLDGAAGIGGGYKANMTGTVNIGTENGSDCPEVFAYGATGGAGIGGGEYGNGGVVRIYNGEVSAYGGRDAAGLGGGAHGTGGHFWIYDGYLEAVGVDSGAGIGGGLGGDGGYINIHGGTIWAVSRFKDGYAFTDDDGYGAGIGGGKNRSFKQCIITGGNIKAEGNTGIGSGYQLGWFEDDVRPTDANGREVRRYELKLRLGFDETIQSVDWDAAQYNLKGCRNIGAKNFYVYLPDTCEVRSVTAVNEISGSTTTYYPVLDGGFSRDAYSGTPIALTTASAFGKGYIWVSATVAALLAIAGTVIAIVTKKRRKTAAAVVSESVQD